MRDCSARVVQWRAFGLVLLGASAACLSSGGSMNESATADTEGATSGADGTAGLDEGPAAGQPGGPCQSDGDCEGGGACLPPAFFPDGDRVCGPPCTQETHTQDCQALRDLDYYLEVGLPSPSGEGNNLWNSAALYRGNVCNDDGFCQFLCPDLSAAAFDDADNVIGCACLPHFTWTADGNHCEWDENVECALIEKAGENACDACNSDQIVDGCSTGRYQCLLYTEAFSGECVEWVESAELQACVAGGFGYDCDAECYSNCAASQCTPDFCNVDSDACLDLCCTETTAPPASGGECDPTGGGDGDGGGMEGPENTPGACTDAFDNDGDGYTDCDASFPDFDCCGVADCPCTGACAGNGACAMGGAENTPAACTDRIDNDGDGYIDCDASAPDFDCCGVGECGCNGACAGQGACP